MLIFGDSHWGSGKPGAKKLLEALQGYKARRLIIGGDLNENGYQLSPDERKALDYLKSQQEKIVYVFGNHDTPNKKSLAGEIGVKPVERFVFEVNGEKACVIHGHQFDRFYFFFSEPLIDYLLERTFRLLRWADRCKNHLSRWLDILHEKLAHHFIKKARRYAKKHKFSTIICFHLHRHGHVFFPGKRPVDYWNGGETGDGCSFITIGYDGKIELHA